MKSRFHTLVFDEWARSRVIGVVLMVGIVVGLSTVVGLLTLGAEPGEAVPSATFTFDLDDRSGAGADDRLVVTHEGGNSIDGDRLRVAVSGVAVGDSGPLATEYTVAVDWSARRLGAGAVLTVAEASDLVDADGTHPAGSPPVLDLSRATVRVIQTSADGEARSVLAVWTAPRA